MNIDDEPTFVQMNPKSHRPKLAIDGLTSAKAIRDQIAWVGENRGRLLGYVYNLVSYIEELEKHIDDLERKLHDR